VPKIMKSCLNSNFFGQNYGQNTVFHLVIVCAISVRVTLLAIQSKGGQLNQLRREQYAGDVCATRNPSDFQMNVARFCTGSTSEGYK